MMPSPRRGRRSTTCCADPEVLTAHRKDAAQLFLIEAGLDRIDPL
jgi:hypothetical protein